MNELYAEAGVKIRPPFHFVFLKVFLVVVIVVMFFLAIATGNPLFGPLLGVLAIVAVFLWPRISKIEYEYIFCDGQFDFDRITGGARRKNMLKVDMENVEVIVSPEKRADFDNPSIRTVKNFSNNINHAYMLIASTESNQLKVYFKPTEKMIECMKNKAPSKVKI